MARRIPTEVISEAAAMLKRGVSLTQAAKALGKTAPNLADALQRRGLYKTFASDRAWSAAEIEFLLTHYKDVNWPAELIAERLGRTTHVVIGKAESLLRQAAKEQAKVASPRRTIRFSLKHRLDGRTRLPTLNHVRILQWMGCHERFGTEYKPVGVSRRRAEELVQFGLLARAADGSRLEYAVTGAVRDLLALLDQSGKGTKEYMLRGTRKPHLRKHVVREA